MWSTPLLAAAAVAAASGNQAPIVAVTGKTDEGETEGGEKVGGGSAFKFFPGLGRGPPWVRRASGPLGARISIVGFLAGFKNE